ncbi:MAG: glycosyl hydrolase-related protein, partial [Gemmatimonadota bacterium]
VLPIVTTWRRDALAILPPRHAVELSGEGLVLSAIKPAEDGDGMVLRCYNALDRPTTGAWKILPPPGSAMRTRGDESGSETCNVSPDGEIAFAAGPHAIVTMRVR